MTANSKKIIAIVGPTACGKTRKAVLAAKAFDGEIISADSRQVYKDMSIGTGKDIDEYGEIAYHLIDIRPAGYKYNLHEYITDFHIALERIRKAGKTPVVCGGTGMYVETALSGMRLPEVPRNESLRAKLDGMSLLELTEMLSQMKQLHNNTDVDTVARAVRAIEIAQYYNEHPEAARISDRTQSTPLDSLIICLDIDRDCRRERISARLESRLQQGLTEEVQKLLDAGIAAEDLIYYGLEYKFVTLYLTGTLSYDEMKHSLETAIHQFAKRQMTWFRGMERRGFKLHHLPHDMQDDEFIYAIKHLLQHN